MSSPDRLRVPVRDGELFVERTGQGPPVVLLHSGLLTASMWDPQVDALAGMHTVIRYDARSHGRSSTATADYRLEDDLLALLDALEVETATLVGSSLGGGTATTCALRYPDRVSDLVLTGPGLTPTEFHDPFVLAQHREQADAVAAADAERYVEAFLRYAVDGPYRAPHDSHPDVRARCREMAMSTVSAHHGATGQPLEHDTRSGLEQVEAPTTLVMGELDLPDLHRVAEEAARRMPRADLVTVPGCGHMLNLEGPQAFNRLVHAHLHQVGPHR
jgi:3-oxoadipate enol-lactonase